MYHEIEEASCSCQSKNIYILKNVKAKITKLSLSYILDHRQKERSCNSWVKMRDIKLERTYAALSDNTLDAGPATLGLSEQTKTHKIKNFIIDK